MSELNTAELVINQLNRIECKLDTGMYRAFLSGAEHRKLDKKSIYREVEDMLRARSTLLENIKEYQEELSEVEMGVKGKRTANDIVMMSQKRLSAEEFFAGRQITLEAKIERDKSILKLLDKGLRIIRKDPFYQIIELRYFDNMSVSEVAAKLKMEESLVIKRGYELVKKISWKVFSGEVL